jgi:hypothetical protein
VLDEAANIAPLPDLDELAVLKATVTKGPGCGGRSWRQATG